MKIIPRSVVGMQSAKEPWQCWRPHWGVQTSNRSGKLVNGLMGSGWSSWGTCIRVLKRSEKGRQGVDEKCTAVTSVGQMRVVGKAWPKILHDNISLARWRTRHRECRGRHSTKLNGWWCLHWHRSPGFLSCQGLMVLNLSRGGAGGHLGGRGLVTTEPTPPPLVWWEDWHFEIRLLNIQCKWKRFLLLLGQNA